MKLLIVSGLIIYYCAMNQEQKVIIGPILNIHYKENDGLVFHWNFHGTKSPKTYANHCFINVSEDASVSHRFMAKYYEIVRSGELVATAKKSRNDHQFKKVKWIEKSMYTPVMKEQCPKRITFKFTELEQIVSFIFQEVYRQKGIIMINVFIKQLPSDAYVDQVYQRLNILVAQLRKQFQGQGFPIINLLNQYIIDHTINSVSGVNMISLAYGQERACQFLKKYLTSINIGKMQLNMQLKSNNSFYGPCQSDSWSPLDFSTYQKSLYCPYNTNFDEKIILMLSESQNRIKVQLKFDLRIEFLDGSSLICSKIYPINEDTTTLYSKTLGILQKQYKIDYIGDKKIMTNLKEDLSYIGVVSGKQARQYS